MCLVQHVVVCNAGRPKKETVSEWVSEWGWGRREPRKPSSAGECSEGEQRCRERRDMFSTQVNFWCCRLNSTSNANLSVPINFSTLHWWVWVQYSSLRFLHVFCNVYQMSIFFLTFLQRKFKFSYSFVTSVSRKLVSLYQNLWSQMLDLRYWI